MRKPVFTDFLPGATPTTKEPIRSGPVQGPQKPSVANIIAPKLTREETAKADAKRAAAKSKKVLKPVRIGKDVYDYEFTGWDTMTPAQKQKALDAARADILANDPTADKSAVNPYAETKPFTGGDAIKAVANQFLGTAPGVQAANAVASTPVAATASKGLRGLAKNINVQVPASTIYDQEGLQMLADLTVNAPSQTVGAAADVLDKNTDNIGRVSSGLQLGATFLGAGQAVKAGKKAFDLARKTGSFGKALLKGIEGAVGESVGVTAPDVPVQPKAALDLPTTPKATPPADDFATQQRAMIRDVLGADDVSGVVMEDPFARLQIASGNSARHESFGKDAISNGLIKVGDEYDAKLKTGETIKVRVTEADLDSVTVTSLDGKQRKVLSPGDARLILRNEEAPGMVPTPQPPQPLQPQPVVDVPVAKEVWQMTPAEYKESGWHYVNDQNVKSATPREGFTLRPNKDEKGRSWLPIATEDAWHKLIVKSAIREGKPVPPEVLAEYPDLKPPAPKEPQPPTPAPKMVDMAPKSPEPATVPTIEPERAVTSARKVMVADDRSAMGLDELDDAVRKSFGQSLDNARAKGYGESWAQRKADAVKEKPMALNDEETAGMVDVMAGLKKQHKSILDQIANEADTVKLDKLRDDLTGIEKQFDNISEAVKLSGTEKGRALASQKITLNEDFDLISVKSRAKAAKGADLSTAEVEKYDDLVNRLDEAEARIAQVETANVDLQAIIDSMPTGAKPGRRIARSQSEIKAARADALSKWSKSVTSSPLGAGIDPTAYDYKALGQYIATFAEEGVGKVEDVIRAAIANAKANGVELSEADAKKGLIEWGTPKKSTRELDAAIFQRDRLRREIRNAIQDQGSSRMDKIKREAMALPRALQATGDLSATLRQGLILGMGNKRNASAAFAKAMRALVDPVYAAKLERELMSSPMAIERKKAKLYIADGETMSLAEEAFMSKIAKEFPILKIVSGASERHYTTFLNQLRATVFDDMIARFPDMDMADKKALADFINVSTGRGRVSPGISETASKVFFSPRFMASRIEAPLDAIGLTKQGRAMWKSPAARHQLTKSWGTVIGGGVGLLSLAKLGGAEVSIDPDSPDFGKARFGDTSFDVWGGLQQPVRLLAKLSKQTASGKKPEWGKDTAKQVMQFLRYKLAPLPNIIMGVADKQDAVGQPFLVNKKGEMTAATVGEDAIKTVSPLLWKELANLWTSNNTPGLAKIIGTAGATLGVGVNTYERKKTEADKKKEAEAKKSAILK